MFGLFESSRARGAPVNLYLFRYGSAPGAFEAFTDAEQAVVFGGVTYVPVPISRGAVVVTGLTDKTRLDITVARNNPIPEKFRVYPPTENIRLKIYQGHIGDPDGDYKLMWSGRVVSCAWEEGSRCKLTCEPMSTRLQNAGLKRNWQVACPHVLYGPLCKANRASFTVSSTVSAIDGATITLPTGWHGAFAYQRFLGGILQWAAVAEPFDQRSILRVIDSTHIKLGGLPVGLSVGAAISLSLGCKHTLEDCGNFSNERNYGGCPWIPFKNPVGFTNPFY